MGAPVWVEKRKWNGRLSAASPAHLVSLDRPVLAWLVTAGTVRSRPHLGVTERVVHDELWITASDEWWVLCATAAEAGDHSAGGRTTIGQVVLHAAVPVEPTTSGRIAWIDLDLDLKLSGPSVALEDTAEFHLHATSMSYPKAVVRGAWSGVSRMAPRYTNGEWPFDGWLDRSLRTARSRAATRRRASRRGFEPLPSRSLRPC